MLESPPIAALGAADVRPPVRIPRAEGCRERDADDGAACDSNEADAKWADSDSGSTFSLPRTLTFTFKCGFAFEFKFAFPFTFAFEIALDCTAAARIAVSLARATAAESPLAGVSDNVDDEDEDDDDNEEEAEEDEETTDDDEKLPSDDFGRRLDAKGDAAPNAASACGDNADDEDERPCTAPADSGRLFGCAADDGESSMAEAGR